MQSLGSKSLAPALLTTGVQFAFNANSMIGDRHLIERKLIIGFGTVGADIEGQSIMRVCDT
jgi:hypothetical protein